MGELAANFRLRALELRKQAGLAQTESTKAKFRSAAEDWERMAEVAESTSDLPDSRAITKLKGDGN